MRFLKLETSDQDTRWINLEQVSRATLGTDGQGRPILVVAFADGNVDESLRIHGTDEVNRRAIQKFSLTIDELSQAFEKAL